MTEIKIPRTGPDTTPGEALYALESAAFGREAPWSAVHPTSCGRYEDIAAGLLAAFGCQPQPAPELADLATLVREAVGTASMCWEHPERAGEFDGKQANRVADNLLAVIGRQVQAVPVNEPAKVIIVTEVSGRQARYELPAFGKLHSGDLVIGTKRDDGDVEVDVMYPPGEWKRAAKDGAEVPNATDRAFLIAHKALTEIVKRSADGGATPFGRIEIGAVAGDALNKISAAIKG